MTTAVLVGAYVVYAALTLSPSQEAEKDLGQFRAYAGFGAATVPLGRDLEPSDLDQAVQQAGATSYLSILQSHDVELADRPDANVVYREGAWSRATLEGRFILTSGRWPASPGEVLVSDPKAAGAVVGKPLSLFADRAAVEVVGTYDDKYFDTVGILSASGTWARLDPQISEAFPRAVATPIVYWTGANDQNVLSALAKALRNYANDPDGLLEALRGSYQTRGAVESEARSEVERWPMAYAIPAVFLPVAAAGFAFGIAGRRLRRAVRRLGAVGVGSRTSVPSVVGGLSIWLLTAVLVGGAAGVLLGAAARQILPFFLEQPLSPMPVPWLPVLQVLTVTSATAVIAGIQLRSGAKDALVHSLNASGARSNKRARDLRHLMAGLAGCVSLWFVVRMESGADAMWLAGAMLIVAVLLVPEASGAVLRLLPQSAARARLVTRQLAHDRGRVSSTVAVVTISVGLSVGFVSLLDTMIRTAQLQEAPPVLSAQLLVSNSASQFLPPPDDALQAVNEVLQNSEAERIQLHFLGTFSPEKETALVHLPTEWGKPIMTVDGTRQAATVIGRPLTALERAKLTNGGMLIWLDSEFAQSSRAHMVSLQFDPAARPEKTTPPIPVAYVDAPLTQLRKPTDGLMLTSTARQLQIPIHSDAAIMFAPVTKEGTREAKQALRAAGLNAANLQSYRPTDPPIPPLVLRVTAVILLLLLCVVTVTAARGQVRALQPQVAALRAIGLSRRWLASVVVTQNAVLASIGAIIGVVVSLPPVVAASLLITHYQLSLPWGQMAAILVATLTGVVVATLISVRSLYRTAD